MQYLNKEIFKGGVSMADNIQRIDPLWTLELRVNSNLSVCRFGNSNVFFKCRYLVHVIKTMISERVLLSNADCLKLFQGEINCKDICDSLVSDVTRCWYIISLHSWSECLILPYIRRFIQPALVATNKF